MVSAISWTLVSSPPVTSSSSGAGSGSPELPCPLDAFTQQDFLDLFDRILPPHYLDPLKAPGPGYELYQGAAKMFARVSEATEHLGCGSFILSATGGAKATGEVELYRPGPSTEAGLTVIVKAGTVVSASRSGRQFVTTEDATFTEFALGPFLVDVEAIEEGYEYNLPGIVLLPDGGSLEGEIDTVDTLVEDPAVGDITIRVRQPTATTGGTDSYLDQHGLDRNIARAAGELDSVYRGRIRAIPDNISPSAVDRSMQQILLPYGQAYEFIETWSIDYQTCWDGPPDAIAGSSYDPSLFCWDDPRPVVPFRNRWMDTNEERGAFIIVVPAFGPVNDTGMAYDDTATNATDLSNTYGARAVGAFDVPSTLADFVHPAWDGYDLARAAAMKTVYDTLQRIKAAGIAAVLELQGA